MNPMFLAREFNDPLLNLTLELFIRMISEQFKERLLSVVLYGSVTFDDLAPGYGDLDFLVVVTNELSEKDFGELTNLRKPFRSGKYGVFAHMLEGVFLPRKMLNPAVKGKAFWWGTSGERMWTENQLGWLVLHVIRERSVVIWGKDLRMEFPVASREALLEDVANFCKGVRANPLIGDIHSIEWLLSGARLLLWLKENRLSAKSEAADWGVDNVQGKWRELLPKAKYLRLNPHVANTADWKDWFNTLEPYIYEAINELEMELKAQGIQVTLED